MVATCAHCGAIRPAPRFELGLSPLEYATYRYIASHQDCTTEEIVAYVYSDREDGGPLSARHNIHTFIHCINRKLSDHLIRSTKGQGATYSLMKIKDPN